ncbi:MAG: hypothetical protein ACOCW1_05075, partial [Chitinispirillaceae bacterium]
LVETPWCRSPEAGCRLFHIPGDRNQQHLKRSDADRAEPSAPLQESGTDDLLQNDETESTKTAIIMFLIMSPPEILRDKINTGVVCGGRNENMLIYEEELYPLINHNSDSAIPAIFIKYFCSPIFRVALP